MIALRDGKFQAGGDVCRFQVRVIGQDFLVAGSRRQQCQHILDPHPQAPDTGLSPRICRVR